MFILNNVGKRKVEVLNDILSAYTDALVNSDDDEYALSLLKQYPDDISVLEDLLNVSCQLHDIMSPVKPRSGFISDLKTELRESHTALVADREDQYRRRVTRVTNTLGTVLSILAVTALLAQLIGAIMMLLTLRARRRRSVAAT